MKRLKRPRPLPVRKNDDPPPRIQLQLTDVEDTERAAGLYRRIIQAQAITLAEWEEEEQKRNDAA
jgi:hypothetical protein